MELAPWNNLEIGETREPGNSFYLDCYHFLLHKKLVKTKKKRRQGASLFSQEKLVILNKIGFDFLFESRNLQDSLRFILHS